MTQPDIPAALAAEFDMLMARAGVAVPAEYRDSILASYADFRAQLPLLHGARTYLSEPSNIFSLATKARA